MSGAMVIRPDEGNMIELPGVGPCPRPVDIDQGVTGFKRLKSLRVYRFAPGRVIEGESEIDEVWITPITGTVRIDIAGAHPIGADLATGAQLYMTPYHAYRLAPSSPALVAYARAEAEGRIGCHLAEGELVKGEHLSLRRVSLAPGEALDLPVSETLALVAEGKVRAGEEILGALDVLALADATLLPLVAEDPAVVWIYSA